MAVTFTKNFLSSRHRALNVILVWQGCLQTLSSSNVTEHPEKLLRNQPAVVQKSKQLLNANLSW